MTFKSYSAMFDEVRQKPFLLWQANNKTTDYLLSYNGDYDATLRLPIASIFLFLLINLVIDGDYLIMI